MSSGAVEPGGLLLAGVVGLAVGSFLNVVITRLPRGESPFRGRSRCPQCSTPVRWRDNLPVISYLLMRGRCRACGAAIPWRYPVVELISGLLTAALWFKFPASPLLAAYAPFCAGLVALSFLDLEHFWLPDVLTLPLTALGLLLSLVLPHLRWYEAWLGALVGGGAFYAVAGLYRRLTGREGLGLGDAKLLALIGAFLGVHALPWVVLVSALLGAGVGAALIWREKAGRLTPIPYGPFLAAAALLYLFLADIVPGLGAS
ncbi:MAG: prepilin peptidase [Syntrophobacterales bacterium]|nr:prepilin peptidase [Syntrophobacterales bacterium]